MKYSRADLLADMNIKSNHTLTEGSRHLKEGNDSQSISHFHDFWSESRSQSMLHGVAKTLIEILQFFWLKQCMFVKRGSCDHDFTLMRKIKMIGKSFQEKGFLRKQESRQRGQTGFTPQRKFNGSTGGS